MPFFPTWLNQRSVNTYLNTPQEDSTLGTYFIGNAAVTSIDEALTEETSSGINESDKTRDGYLARVIGYIPSAIIGTYLFIQGILQQSRAEMDYPTVLAVIAIALGIVTPFFTLFSTVKEDTATKKYRFNWYQTIAATISFPVWIFAIGGPFAELPWYRPFLGSIVLALVSGIILPFADQVIHVFKRGIARD